MGGSLPPTTSQALTLCKGYQPLATETQPSNPIAARILIFLCKHRFHVPLRLTQIVLGSDFFPRDFGQRLVMPHPYGIIVHSRVKIGDDVTLFHGVTIGGSRPGSGVPKIGSQVVIGAGASILGEISVGNRVTIGANTVVTKDVPDNATVVGINRILSSTDSF